MFNNKFHRQIDGVPLGPLLDPALANIFKRAFENKRLKDCTHDLKPVFNRRCVHGVFLLCLSLDHAGRVKEYLLYNHPNINISLETEKDGCLSF